MRIHSTVGLVTNSSSETYTRIHDDYEETLYKIGQEIIDALGIEGDAHDVFEVVKELNYNGRDKLAKIEEGTEVPLNSENWSGYESANYDVFLVVRASGVKLDFSGFDGRLYSSETIYNG